jgi:O-antigen ligase
MNAQPGPNLGWDERLLGVLLLGYALMAPISIALSQPLVFAAFPIWLYGVIRRRDARPLRSPYFLPIVLFMLLAFASSLWAIHPDITFPKCHRLLMLPLVFIVGSVFRPDRAGGWTKATWAVALFVCGTTFRAFYDVCRVAGEVSGGTPLFQTGTMRDPQMYMTALCLLVAILLYPPRPGLVRRARWAVLANAVGLVIHFKRGAWFSFGLAMGIVALVARRWRILGVLALCGLGLLLVPQTRARLAMLRDESSFRMGGRYVLWTEVAPGLLRDHPLGVGWGGVRYRDLRSYYWGVQRGLKHVHNNVLQVAIEVGWMGLALWLWWMGTAFAVMGPASRRGVRRPGESSWLALGLLAAFSALMFNGVVEYNFGDSEILMLLCFLMGLSDVVREKQRLEESAVAGGIPSS